MMKMKVGLKAAVEVGDTVVTVTSGGLTTWIELFKKDGSVGPATIFDPGLIMGDTKHVLRWLKTMVKQIQQQQKQWTED